MLDGIKMVVKQLKHDIIKYMNKNMKTYKIPVVWQCWGLVEVKAENIEDAKDMAMDAPLPNGEYVCDSCEIDEDGIELYN